LPIEALLVLPVVLTEWRVSSSSGRPLYVIGIRDSAIAPVANGDMENPVANPTVLVADDHGLVLAQVVALLRPTFDVIGTADNGSDLVADAARLRPDVIVLDISMPILNGIEAAHKLREKGSAAKLVFLTAHTDPEFADACFTEGALGYVTKSRLRADLVAALNDALAGRRFISSTVIRQSTVR